MNEFFWRNKKPLETIPSLKYLTSFRGCLHVKFHPGMKSSLSMVKCLLLFTRFCQDEISSRDEKKKKRHVNTSSRDEILKWACFFNFWRMYSGMFSKFNMFEHNESMNIVKHRPPDKKWSPKRKRMKITSKKSTM